jgi:prevent-host-death family protein
METTIGAAAFKEKCLSLLDDVGPDGIVITKHGKPVARLVSIEARSRDLIGALEGELEIKGDILTTGLGWDAQS